MSNFSEAQFKIQKTLDLAASTVIAYAAPEVPAVGNLTKFSLLEEFGRLNEARKALEKVEKIVKIRLQSQLDGAKVLRGDNFEYKCESSDRYALDQSTAKAKLLELGGQEALDACMVSSAVERVTVKPLF